MTITIYYQGLGLLVFKTIADEMNLRPGQRVSEVLFWEILRRNAEFGIDEYTKRLTEQTSKL